MMKPNLNEEPKGQIGSGSRKGLDEYVRNQRSNPYYVLMSVLFAVTLGRLAQWLATIIESTPFDFGRPENGNSTSTSTDTAYFAVQFILAILVFLVVIQLWWYFSRILVYIDETPTGELCSYALGFTVLVAVSALPKLWWHWPLLLALCTLAVFFKSGQIKISLRKQAIHPIHSILPGWIMASGAYSALLILIGVGYRPQFDNKILLDIPLAAIFVSWLAMNLAFRLPNTGLQFADVMALYKAHFEEEPAGDVTPEQLPSNLADTASDNVSDNPSATTSESDEETN